MTSVKYIPGEGPRNPKLVFIGEAPGEEEDRQGRPFVGRSGKLLDKMIAFLGFARSEVYITNIVKVRPYNNRTPEPEEIKSWLTLLFQELLTLDMENTPIITLGSVATNALMEANLKISEMRGQVLFPHTYRIVPTFHPAYVLRNPKAKELVKKDLLVAKGLINAPSEEF